VVAGGSVSGERGRPSVITSALAVGGEDVRSAELDEKCAGS
jgi:hypothetical protein